MTPHRKLSAKEWESSLSIGGLLIECAEIKPLTQQVDEIAQSFGIPPGTEIKWSPPSTNWIYRNLVGKKRTECYRQILEAAQNSGGRAVCIVWDLGRTTLQGKDAFQKCVDFLFERITIHLEKRDDYCLIVADRPGGGQREDDAFLTDFIDRVQSGTKFVSSDRVLLNVLTTPSHLVRQLQVADLITSVTTAMVAGKYRFASPLFDTIKDMLIQNHDNFIGGTGLKIFPDKLVNLYHWLLDEEYYGRIGCPTEKTLPTDRYPYSTDEDSRTSPKRMNKTCTAENSARRSESS